MEPEEEWWVPSARQAATKAAVFFKERPAGLDETYCINLARHFMIAVQLPQNKYQAIYDVMLHAFREYEIGFQMARRLRGNR